MDHALYVKGGIALAAALVAVTAFHALTPMALQAHILAWLLVTRF